jgi:hypothetical protein
MSFEGLCSRRSSCASWRRPISADLQGDDDLNRETSFGCWFGYGRSIPEPPTFSPVAENSVCKIFKYTPMLATLPPRGQLFNWRDSNYLATPARAQPCPPSSMCSRNPTSYPAPHSSMNPYPAIILLSTNRADIDKSDLAGSAPAQSL